jgi:CRISPR/Cas system-associated exonuclease Cas4 (RecB family)
MPAFLRTLTQHIYSHWKERMGSICIVLPNRRASLFIKGYLSEIIEKTSFLPDFFSIEDFVAHCSQLGISDQLGDQFRLYQIHCSLAGSEARSIEEFFPYAAWMMSDFNEIDMYLVDEDQLFSYLNDAKAMALWNPDGRPLTGFQERYLGFFRSLKDYYHGLHAMLEAEDMAYQGMAFRRLAHDIEAVAEGWRWDKVIFAGFNALTPAEEKIIAHLLKAGKAEILWDADKYYVDNPSQEAGIFLRRHFKDLQQQSPRWVEDNYTGSKDIHVTGIPKNAGQVKYAGEILNNILKKEGTLDNTALVLADENLLIPLLNSIPAEAGKFNVTMGLALKNTPLFDLLDALLGTYQNADRFSQLRKVAQTAYYSKDVLRVIGHPWTQMLIEDEQLLSNIAGRIRDGNRIFLPRDLLRGMLQDGGAEAITDLLFPPEREVAPVIASFSALIAALRKSIIKLRKDSTYDYAAELEYLFRFSNLLQRLDGLTQTFESVNNIKTLQMVFRQLASQQRIPFRGEPLQGLQVMGVLETRTLDFERVIMLSVNEGTLPAARMPNSFIPFDIKQTFALPTYRHQDAVFAYHFYRLLQRAKEVHLIYDTEAGHLGGGEKSRFIKQLQHEGPVYHSGISITDKLLSVPPGAVKRDTAIVIEKDEEVLRLLLEEAQKGFHPSSLNIFINCPLQFYLARLLRIEEAEDIEETIDAKTLGTVLHEALKNLLGQYTGQKLNKKHFEDLKRSAKKEVQVQFGKFYHESDISFGKNYLIVHVAVNMLMQVFERESSWLGDGECLILTDLEKTFYTALDIAGPGPGNVNFRGTIDRVDERSGRIRILDYKTGYVRPAKLKPATWDELFSDPGYSQAFQLLMYSWLYQRKHPAESELTTGIISLRAPGAGPMMVKPPGSEALDKMVFEEFEQRLKTLVREIFDPARPFVQTEDEDRCRYCSFRETCNRSIVKDNFK